MHVGRALQEPEQLMDDRLHVQLLGGDEREALAEIEAHLMAEERDRAGPGAVPFSGSALAHAGEEIEILAQSERFLLWWPWTGPPGGAHPVDHEPSQIVQLKGAFNA